MRSLQQIRQRKLFQWALAYLAGAWLLLQVVLALAASFGWSALVPRVTIVLLAVGFPAALIVAWYHGEQGRQRISSVELGMLAGILVIAGVGVAWVRGPATPAGAASAAVVGAAVDAASIAVLPFADLSPEGDQGYFSDGISEELLNVLAQVPKLRVAARTSAFAFKGKEVGIDSIGRALRVAHVLEGSVRTAGERVRITAQLIDARTGYHLWSQTYDRELSDILRVQDEIAEAITERLRRELGAELGVAKGRPVRAVQPEAHQLTLRALHRVRTGTGTDRLVESERLLDRALELDPDYAHAYALRSNVVFWQMTRGALEPREALPRIESDLRRALELDPGEPRAHVARGLLAADQGRFQEAEQHYQRALREQPGHDAALFYMSQLWLLQGRVSEAVDVLERAARLDPLSITVQRGLGIMYSFAGQQRRSVEQLRSALELDPGNPRTLASLSFSLTYVAEHAEAIDAARRAVAGDSSNLMVLGHALGYAGRHEEARRVLRILEQRGESAWDLANVTAALGDRERTIELLTRSVDEGGSGILPYDLTFAPYHDDPRMQALIARVRGRGR